jgi:phospholipase/carboxylesterase
MTVASYHALTRAPSAGAPLVFAFHGTGGDEHQFSALAADILPAAGFVAPRGDVCEHGALRFFRRTGEGIYDMEDLALRTRKMAEFVAAHRAENPDRPVYGFGYSNGANILAAVAFRHPDLFDRIALLHPLIPWTPEPSAGLSRKRIRSARRSRPARFSTISARRTRGSNWCCTTADTSCVRARSTPCEAS